MSDQIFTLVGLSMASDCGIFAAWSSLKVLLDDPFPVVNTIDINAFRIELSHVLTDSFYRFGCAVKW
jgi:Ulp1 family protease